MPKANTTITLIGVGLAKIGSEFVFNGPTNECETCKLKNTCLNLDIGRKYRIAAVRGNAKHECALHDGGVKAVEVLESPSIAAIDPKNAFIGSKISYKKSECSKQNCKIYDLCHPYGVIPDEKYTIGAVLGDVHDSCVEGRPLKLVELIK
jgi:uncharacterized protein (UPF0179 family)